MGRKEKCALLISLLFLVGFLIISFTNNTTGDTGDSIAHFLYSRYSWTHTEYFFDLWAKPVFTSLSSPFSQFGMIGIKVFNSIVVALTLWVTCLLSIRLRLSYWFLVPFIIVFSPFYGVHIFSGLTEYLYSLLLIFSIYLVHSGRISWGVVICGFLPFARNEGILPIVLMAVYLVWVGKSRYIPLLAIGHLFFAVLGHIVLDRSLLWTITTQTYDPHGSQYGTGDFFTFVKHIRYVMGWPNVFFLIMGHIFLIPLVVPFIDREKKAVFWVVLICGNFLGFYLGHAILYDMGRFSSMGLPRVLHSVVPLAALICAYGMDKIFERLGRFKSYIGCALIGLLCIYPFIPRPGAHIWSKNVLTLPENEFVDDVVMPFISSQGYDQGQLYFNYPYFSLTTGKNALRQVDGMPFMNQDKISKLKIGDVYLWDHWFSVIEGQITHEFLTSQGFEEQLCASDSYWKWKFMFCVYEKTVD